MFGAGVYYIRWIWSIRHLITETAAKFLVHALVISRLDYCNTILYGLPKASIRPLQLVMNYAARVVVNAPRDTSSKALLQHLHWLPVEQRVQFKVLCLTFKGQHKKCPSYITEMLQPYIPTRTLRSGDQNLLMVPRTNLLYGKRAFSVAAPTLWNAMPETIRASKSLQGFKKLLKTHLYNVAFKD